MTATIDVPGVRMAIEPLADALRADGADLVVRDADSQHITIELVVTDDACAECILPKDVLEVTIERTIGRSLGSTARVNLVDPRSQSSAMPTMPE